MKITFNDGSFLEIQQSDKIKNGLLFTMCGLKNKKQLTMSYSDLNKDQIVEIFKFIDEWLKIN